jgi:hypothetical protein
MSSSGGLIYHLRALRFGHQEWKNHTDSVHDFLEAWMASQHHARETTLVLIGPSGGYSLPLKWIGSFSKIIAYEPDAIARKIFNSRFQSVLQNPVQWVKTGYDFQSPLPEGLILFCNLLGQIRIPNIAEFKGRLDRLLEGRAWASYHDALSGPGIRVRVPSFSHSKVDASNIRSWIQTRSTRPIELTAHLAPDLFHSDPGLHFFYWEWRITRKRTHLIEGVFRVNP